MEGVCYLKTIDNLVRSVVSPAISGVPSSLLNAHGSERTKTYLKRVSSDDTFDFREQPSPLKLHFSNYLLVERQQVDVKLVIPEQNGGEYDVKHCVESSAMDSRRSLGFDKSKETSVTIAMRQESRETKVSQMANEHLETTSGSRIPQQGKIQLPNVSKLEKSSSTSSGTGKGHLAAKEVATPLDSDVTVKRCRSLPCKPTHDIQEDEAIWHFLKDRCQSQYINRLEIRCDEASDRKKLHRCNQLYTCEFDKSDSDNRNDHSLCCSGSDTPSSCYIDVEADRSSCSPLNLTTNDAETPLPSLNIPASENKSAKDISYPHRQDDSQNNSNQCDPETARKMDEDLTNEKTQEKKTNFSIDAILRPDFGSARGFTESSDPLQMCNPASLSPRLRGTIKSLHSAFTAVDLSTRSRSDSLSSPSCSSSSPSPTLSACSTSPRLKQDFNSSDKHIAQDRFVISSRVFPDSNVEFHQLFNARIPFINTLHPGRFGHFPFACSPQEDFHTKATFDKESFRHHNPQQSIRTKSDHQINDISKLCSRSLYPFISPVPTCRPDVLKHNANHESETKTGSCTPSQAFRQNKTSKILLDTQTSIKCEKSSAEKVIEAKDGCGVEVDGARREHYNPVSCKSELKQEHKRKRNEKSEDASSKGDDGNQLWPAWVFCTRYSDRPSSGPRSRKPKRSKTQEEKRPRTAFTNDQLVRLKREFEDCRYLTEARRKSLADELGLTESQIKIWFQNKRAKIKKSVGVRNPLALQLMEQGLYNHSTVRLSDDSS